MLPFSRDQTVFHVSDLRKNQIFEFDLRPVDSSLEKLALQLELIELKKLRYFGIVQSVCQTDWKVEGTLRGSVVQPCVATLDPVTTRINIPVKRIFLANYIHSETVEIESSEIDFIEPLGSEIDLFAIMREALSLAIPTYPRKRNAKPVKKTYTEPEKIALEDEHLKPFAQLANLRDSLKENS
ncbi:MAG: DUF177 domain-containing protein [Aestuariivita sp.]|nr:DUF177 domain-containing protein [Aestuariivita sp.]